MKFREEAAGTFISKSLGDIGEKVAAAMEYRDSCESGITFIADNTWTTRFERADIEL